MNDRSPGRESLWNIGRKWIPWCLALIFAMTIGWTVLAARNAVASGKYQSITEIAMATVKDAAPAQPLIVVYAIFVVTTIDMSHGGIMVTYRYLSRKFLEPQRQKILAEGEERGLKRGLEEGIEEGQTARQRLWEEWNARRLEAERNARPFNEPPPGVQDIRQP